ncbi:MAG: PD-(D/E)XK nuclease family protein [Chloroflexota bacterium]
MSAATDWTVKRAEWAPRSRPSPPLGVTSAAVARSCGLRLLFERSDAYARRLSFAARIGTAFHRTMERLSEEGVPANAAEAALIAQVVFDDELAAQALAADTAFREGSLPRDERRVQLAKEAAVAEAVRMARNPQTSTPTETAAGGVPGAGDGTWVEVPVASADGWLRGRIDRIERHAGRLRLVDYKSTLRADLPERYERQVKVYAAMWEQTFGFWPNEAAIVYPLLGTEATLELNPEECTELANDDSAVLREVCTRGAPRDHARPGDVCKACEFRPWCEPFWAAQVSDANTEADVLERAYLGFEGTVVEVLDGPGFVRGSVTWRGRPVSFIADPERFPQLRSARPGMNLRFLEWRLRGQRHAPQAFASDTGELFLVD